MVPCSRGAIQRGDVATEASHKITEAFKPSARLACLIVCEPLSETNRDEADILEQKDLRPRLRAGPRESWRNCLDTGRNFAEPRELEPTSTQRAQLGCRGQAGQGHILAGQGLRRWHPRQKH